MNGNVGLPRQDRFVYSRHEVWGSHRQRHLCVVAADGWSPLGLTLTSSVVTAASARRRAAAIASACATASGDALVAMRTCSAQQPTRSAAAIFAGAALVS
jgi:hypothetical protein